MSDLKKQSERKIEGSETIMSELLEAMSRINERLTDTGMRLTTLSQKAGVFNDEPTECVDSVSPENVKQALNYMLDRLRTSAYLLERRIAELETFI